MFKNLNLEEAAPEEAIQLRRLIKSSNESLGPCLFEKLSFGFFRVPQLRYQGRVSVAPTLYST